MFINAFGILFLIVKMETNPGGVNGGNGAYKGHLSEPKANARKTGQV